MLYLLVILYMIFDIQIKQNLHFWIYLVLPISTDKFRSMKVGINRKKNYHRKLIRKPFLLEDRHRENCESNKDSGQTNAMIVNNSDVKRKSCRIKFPKRMGKKSPEVDKRKFYRMQILLCLWGKWKQRCSWVFAGFKLQSEVTFQFSETRNN